MEHLAVTAAGHVHSQWSESNNGWCSDAGPSSVLTSEVTWAMGGAVHGLLVVVGYAHLWSLR